MIGVDNLVKPCGNKVRALPSKGCPYQWSWLKKEGNTQKRLSRGDGNVSKRRELTFAELGRLIRATIVPQRCTFRSVNAHCYFHKHRLSPRPPSFLSSTSSSSSSRKVKKKARAIAFFVFLDLIRLSAPLFSVSPTVRSYFTLFHHTVVNVTLINVTRTFSL